MMELGNRPGHYFPMLRDGILARAEGRELELRHDSKCSQTAMGRLPVGGAISVHYKEQIGSFQGKMEVVLREDRPGERLAQASLFLYEAYNSGLQTSLLSM